MGSARADLILHPVRSGPHSATSCPVGSARADLILHPVRMRLMAALARRHLTARQLGELLPDVPQATLYHHLGLLTRAGLLRIVSERPVRGTVERVYTIAGESAVVPPSEVARAARDDLLRYFTIFVSTLLGDFARYLERETPIDLAKDGVSFRQTPFYLSDEEFAQAAAALQQALLPFLEYEPAPNRSRRLFTAIIFPDPDLPGAAEQE